MLMLQCLLLEVGKEVLRDHGTEKTETLILCSLLEITTVIILAIKRNRANGGHTDDENMEDQWA